MTTAVEAALTPELVEELHTKMFLTADYRNPEDTIEYLRMQQEQVAPLVETMLADESEDN